MKVISFTMWLLLFIIITTTCFEMISAANTIANIVGVLVLVAAIILSWKTNCFTKFLKSNNK